MLDEARGGGPLSMIVAGLSLKGKLGAFKTHPVTSYTYFFSTFLSCVCNFVQTMSLCCLSTVSLLVPPYPFRFYT